MTQKTKDYSIFNKKNDNRDIKPKNLQKIIASIQSRNMLDLCPIICDANMCVMDGQHRLEAAKKLGLEIYYQIDPNFTSKDMVLINANTFKWTTDEYIHHYIAQGNQEYIKLREFSDKMNLSAHDVASYTGSSYSENSKNIKTGAYKFMSESKEIEFTKNWEKVLKITETIRNYSLDNCRIRCGGRFSEACYSFICREDVDFEVMMKKIILNLDRLRPCTNSQAYYVMLRDIYNYKNVNPVD